MARYDAPDHGFPFPLHDTLRILLAKPSGQTSSNAKAAARIPPAVGVRGALYMLSSPIARY